MCGTALQAARSPPVPARRRRAALHHPVTPVRPSYQQICRRLHTGASSRCQGRSQQHSTSVSAVPPCEASEEWCGLPIQRATSNGRAIQALSHAPTTTKRCRTPRWGDVGAWPVGRALSHPITTAHPQTRKRAFGGRCFCCRCWESYRAPGLLRLAVMHHGFDEPALNPRAQHCGARRPGLFRVY